MKGAPAVTTATPIYRAASELSVEGRTLLGLAAPYDTPALVSDFGGPRYWEALSPSVFVRSLEQQPWPRPMYMHHEWAVDSTAEPLGVAEFVQSPDESALLFRAHVGKSRKGDMVLDRYKSGRPTGVSVGADPLPGGNVMRSVDGKDVLFRTEAKLLELSISRSGLGQYREAKVLALRSAPESMALDDRQSAVYDEIGRGLFGDGNTLEDGTYFYFEKTYEDHVVYSVTGPAIPEADAGLWSVTYEIDGDGAVTLGEPFQVEETYTPIARAASDAAPGLIIPAWLADLQRYRQSRGF